MCILWSSSSNNLLHLRPLEGSVQKPIVMVGALPYDWDANRWNRLLDVGERQSVKARAMLCLSCLDFYCH